GGDRERGAPGRHAGRASGSDRPDLDVALNARDGTDHRRSQGGGQTVAAGTSGAEGDCEDGEGIEAPGTRRRRWLLRVPEGRKKIPLAGSGTRFRPRRRELRYRGNEGPHPLPPGD